MYVDEQTMAGLMVMMGGMATALSVLSIIFAVMLIIAHWKMYTKAGEKGWKSLIPIYSDYILYKLTWSPAAFWIFVLCSVLCVVFAMLSGTFVISANGEVIATGTGNTLFSILTLIVSILTGVIHIMLQVKIAVAYDRGVGTALGLIFLPNIFSLYLGFGSARYIGPEEK
jgi:hypothetical protein